MRSMFRRLLGRHSTAVAYVALFAALGGSAYAAATITGKNIKDGTMTGKDVKNRSPETRFRAKLRRRGNVRGDEFRRRLAPSGSSNRHLRSGGS